MKLRIALAVLVIGSCGREVPTGVGGSLLPEDAVRTFEVLLDGSAWLVRDTAFSKFDRAFGAPFLIVAENFDGALDAHTLARFGIPAVIAALDSTGVSRNDSTPVFIGGRVVLQLDTLRSSGDLPILMRIHRITESWDPATASWTHRVDSAGNRQTWAQPGALGGPAIDTASWTGAVDSLGVRVDSLVIPVDSQTIAAWSDTTTNARGVVITMVTPGGRLRSSDLVLRLDARPTFRPDTIVTVTSRPSDPVFIYDPVLPDAAPTPFIGGRPSWRTYFEVRDGLDTLSIACPEVSATCRVRLGDVNVTYAGIQLQPAPAPPGFAPQDSLRIGAQTLVLSEFTPIERSPLGQGVGATRRFLQPAEFRPPADGPLVEVPITEFVAALAADTLVDGAPPSRWIGLLPLVEGVDFGLAAFQPSPVLRLILTIANELQLR